MHQVNIRHFISSLNDGLVNWLIDLWRELSLSFNSLQSIDDLAFKDIGGSLESLEISFGLNLRLEISFGPKIRLEISFWLNFRFKISFGLNLRLKISFCLNLRLEISFGLYLWKKKSFELNLRLEIILDLNSG